MPGKKLSIVCVIVLKVLFGILLVVNSAIEVLSGAQCRKAEEGRACKRTKWYHSEAGCSGNDGETMNFELMDNKLSRERQSQ